MFSWKQLLFLNLLNLPKADNKAAVILKAVVEKDARIESRNAKNAIVQEVRPTNANN